VLRLDHIDKRFGALHVARGVNLTLARGARQALIGPNGAGKTTLVHLISGVLQPDSGSLYIGSRNITQMSVEHRVRLGLVRTFQISSLFPHLTVAENVALGVSARVGCDWKFWGEMRRQTRVLDEAKSIIVATGLLADAGSKVSTLAYGRRRLVEIALALALEPKILVLDEPAAGLSSAEREVLVDVLQRLPTDLAVLIIEHDMSLVFRIANKITVLVDGAVLIEGTVDEVRASRRVREIYLGTRSHG
ncbi:MAG: ABC transporter ATP-binding protein, partial [Chthoniobacterales bacterium]